MKDFYKNTTFTLVILISTFAGFSGNLGKIEIKHFTPFLSLKSLLVLSTALFVCSLPNLISDFIKRGKNNER